jgi:hypothetical protein
MKRMLKFSVLVLIVGLVFGLAGCGDGDDLGDDKNGDNNSGDVGDGGGGGDGIKWNNDANATLTILNNTTKDMVIFQGQTPTINNILGGVKGGASREFDISSHVDDFSVGGFMILRGITLDQYNANKSNLGLARIEYSAMATYGQGKKFRTEIQPSYIGDYAYRVTNIGRIGMELRKDSPDGEKVAYLPSLASNMLLYSDSTSSYSLYPVYVYFSRSTGQVTTLKPTSMFETVTVAPRAATGNQIQSYIFPADQGATWDSIKSTLTSPVAYVTITSNVANQTGRVTIAGGNRINSQNGFDGIGSGETLTYEISSTVSGTQQNLVLQYYNGAISLPVKDSGGNTPTLKNGYDYTISVSGSGQTVDGYTITITESASPRDLSNDISSL